VNVSANVRSSRTRASFSIAARGYTDQSSNNHRRDRSLRDHLVNLAAANRPGFLGAGYASQTRLRVFLFRLAIGGNRSVGRAALSHPSDRRCRRIGLHQGAVAVRQIHREKFDLPPEELGGEGEY
jgi:hypothetical protein